MEVSCALDYGHAIWVANNLRIVVVDDRVGNLVGAGGEEDNGRSGSRPDAGATPATSVSGTDGGVNGGGVVGDCSLF